MAQPKEKKKNKGGKKDKKGSKNKSFPRPSDPSVNKSCLMENIMAQKAERHSLKSFRM